MVSVRSDEVRRKAAEGGHAPRMQSYWIRSFLGIAAILLAAAVLLVYLWIARNDQDGRRQLATGTTVLAKTVSAEMGGIRRLLDSWRDDAQLRAAFQSRRPEGLQGKERELATRLPGALGIHLFAAEQASSVEGIPFMSYAGVDLARQAAQELKTTRIEVHKVGQPDMHLAVAAPVLTQTGDRAVGVVHVALPMSLLPSPAGVVGDRGAVLYQQLVGDAVATLGASGGDLPPDPDYAEPIAGTRLRVAAWLKGAGNVDPRLLGEVGATYALVLALIGLALWLGYAALRRALLMDFQGLTALVEDAASRRPLRKVKARVAEVQGVHQEVYDLLRRLHPSRAPLRGASATPRSDTTAPSPPVVDDGLGPASGLAEASIEVEEIDLPESFDPYAAHPMESASGAGFGGANPLETLGDDLASEGPSPVAVPAEVFGAYDIRGIAERQLSAGTMRVIGQALGSEAGDRGERTVMVGRDCRASSPALAAALVEGIRAAGADVVDLGVVPTPLVYFACCHPQPQAGAMVTASHNPPEYNGVKPVFGGVGADGEGVRGLLRRIQAGTLAAGSGGYRTQDAIGPYRDYVAQDVALARNMKIAVDCGNATAAAVVPELFRALGCEVIELNCDMDAGMGEQAPDPARAEDTRALGGLVMSREADLGLAFDGDGDRLGVVDSQGRFVPGDRVLMLLATDILTRHPGSDVVFDVKCSRHLADEIRRAGGRPVMIPSGHAPLKAQARATKAPIAGELSGHIVYTERWFGFDDAIYAGARLLEVLSLDPRATHEIFAALPGGLVTPELLLPLPEGEPLRVMRTVMQIADRLDGVEVIRIDGLRAEFERGWGLVRASNTESKLVFRFEGDDQEALDKIQALYRRLMDKAAPGLSLPF